MAVEIKELVIRAVIVDDKNPLAPASTNALSSEQEDQIVQQCVNQVLKIIKKSNNR